MASFYAKGLILVEQMEKNGLNKEIRRPHRILARAVNLWLTKFALGASISGHISAQIEPTPSAQT
jgi:hypothetical protein